MNKNGLVALNHLLISHFNHFLHIPKNEKQVELVLNFNFNLISHKIIEVFFYTLKSFSLLNFNKTKDFKENLSWQNLVAT